MSLSDDLFEAMVTTTERWAEITLGVAGKQTPVDEGTLKRSGLAAVVHSTDEATATLSFNTEYAEYQHEGVGFNHPNGGNAKYLENAIKTTAPLFKPELQQQVDLVLSRYRLG
jgi:hypothetical protein